MLYLVDESPRTLPRTRLQHERARELRPAGAALSLMSNALCALSSIGIKPDFTDRALVFDSLHFLTRRGRLIRTMRFKEIAEKVGQPNLAIHRAGLQQALHEQAVDCKIVLGAAATRFGTDGSSVRVNLTDGRQVHGDLLIGADGFNSVVRSQIAGPEVPNEGGYVCWRAEREGRWRRVHVLVPAPATPEAWLRTLSRPLARRPAALEQS